MEHNYMTLNLRNILFKNREYKIEKRLTEEKRSTEEKERAKEIYTWFINDQVRI